MKKISLPRGLAGSFTDKVVSALRKTGFSDKELATVRKWVDAGATRNAVVASGASSALSIARMGRGDALRFAGLLESARGRVEKGMQPFAEKELFELEAVLRKSLPVPAAKRLARELANSDEMVFHAIAKKLRETSLTVTLAARPA